MKKKDFHGKQPMNIHLKSFDEPTKYQTGPEQIFRKFNEILFYLIEDGRRQTVIQYKNPIKILYCEISCVP